MFLETVHVGSGGTWKGIKDFSRRKVSLGIVHKSRPKVSRNILNSNNLIEFLEKLSFVT